MDTPKRDRRVAKTNRAIHNAILDLLTEKPLSRLTVSEVARKADIDRKTFYLHYDTVDDAFSAIAIGVIESSVSGLEEFLHEKGNGGSLIEVFEFYFRRIGQLFLDERWIHMRKSGSVPFEATINYFGAPLKRVVSEGKFVNVNIPKHLQEYTSSYLLYLTIGTYMTWLDTGMKESLDELTSMASSLAAHGLAGLLEAKKNT